MAEVINVNTTEETPEEKVPSTKKVKGFFSKNGKKILVLAAAGAGFASAMAVKKHHDSKNGSDPEDPEEEICETGDDGETEE